MPTNNDTPTNASSALWFMGRGEDQPTRCDWGTCWSLATTLSVVVFDTTATTEAKAVEVRPMCGKHAAWNADHHQAQTITVV